MQHQDMKGRLPIPLMPLPGGMLLSAACWGTPETVKSHVAQGGACCTLGQSPQMNQECLVRASDNEDRQAYIKALGAVIPENPERGTRIQMSAAPALEMDSGRLRRRREKSALPGWCLGS